MEKNSQQSYCLLEGQVYVFCSAAALPKSVTGVTLPLGTAPGIAQKSLPDLQARFVP
jgi:hypothetical protein